MTPTPEQLALARRIAGEVFRKRARKPGASYDHEIWQAKVVEQGDGDDYDLVQSALAAIIETSERAAGLAENYKFPSGWVGNDGQAIIADALRSGEHLKGDGR